MGGSISRNEDFTQNDLLKRFVGKDSVHVGDSDFWSYLLKYTIALPTNSEEQLALDSRLEPMCQQFLTHNLHSGNLGTLIDILQGKVNELLGMSEQQSNVQIWETFNALFIIRTLVKYVIETGSEFQLLQHFEAKPTQQQPPQESQSNGHSGGQPAVVLGSKFEAFVEAIINLIVVIPVKDHTYHLHLEAVNNIITLLSVRLYSTQTTTKSIIYRTIFKSRNSNTLTSALLHFVSRRMQAPATMFGMSNSGSFVFGIAESLWSMLTFKKPQDILTSTDVVLTFREHFPLANQSLLLILILTNHNTHENPFRASLFGCADVSDPTTDPPVSFKIDFGVLYQTMCQIVTIDQATLLLYLMLHRNPRFYKFVMAQIELQNLVIPILQTLYNAPQSNSYHIYMSLIILLILSEDEGFNKSVHEIMLKKIHWYTERTISEISLGGLHILVVIRTIQYNMLKMRDKYLHTNCLAALANMSNQFRFLHPYVAQRLVSLFETLAKKHDRLEAQLKRPVEGTAAEATINIQGSNEDMMMDLSVLEEVLRMVLEIINSCLSLQLTNCPNLVYTLLYKKHVFENFRTHAAFQDIIQNIDMVVGFFSSRLQRVQEQKGSELGVNEVLDVISKSNSQWSSDRLRKFADLKFKYVEEDSPEDFFIPYVWSLVAKSGSIHFSAESMKGVSVDTSVDPVNV